MVIFLAQSLHAEIAGVTTVPGCNLCFMYFTDKENLLKVMSQEPQFFVQSLLLITHNILLLQLLLFDRKLSYNLRLDISVSPKNSGPIPGRSEAGYGGPVVRKLAFGTRS